MNDDYELIDSGDGVITFRIKNFKTSLQETP